MWSVITFRAVSKNRRCIKRHCFKRKKRIRRIISENFQLRIYIGKKPLKYYREENISFINGSKKKLWIVKTLNKCFKRINVCNL